MSDLIRDRDTQKTETSRGSQDREQTKEVFGIQLTTVERARDIDTALNIFGQEGGINGLGLD